MFRRKAIFKAGRYEQHGKDLTAPGKDLTDPSSQPPGHEFFRSFVQRCSLLQLVNCHLVRGRCLCRCVVGQARPHIQFHLVNDSGIYQFAEELSELLSGQGVLFHELPVMHTVSHISHKFFASDFALDAFHEITLTSKSGRSISS